MQVTETNHLDVEMFATKCATNPFVSL